MHIVILYLTKVNHPSWQHQLFFVKPQPVMFLHFSALIKQTRYSVLICELRGVGRQILLPLDTARLTFSQYPCVFMLS